MNFSYTDVLAEFGIGSAHPGGFILTKELLHTLQLKIEDHVLDCGCGTGQSSSYIKSTFDCSVTAIDAHPIMVEKARNRFNAEDQVINLIEGSIEEMPFADHSFDLLVSESVAVFTDVDRTLAEYSRVIKPGGILLLNEMVLLEHLDTTAQKKIMDMYQIEQLFYTDEWLKRLSKAGITSIQSCIASPISSLIKQQEDRENDFFPSEDINPIFHEMLAKHQQLSKNYASKLGFILIIAKK